MKHCAIVHDDQVICRWKMTESFNVPQDAVKTKKSSEEMNGRRYAGALSGFLSCLRRGMCHLSETFRNQNGVR